MVLQKTEYQFMISLLLESILVEIIICVNLNWIGFELFLIIGSILCFAFLIIINLLKLLSEFNLNLIPKTFYSFFIYTINSMLIFFLFETALKLEDRIWMIIIFIHFQITGSFEVNGKIFYDFQINRISLYIRWLYILIRIIVTEKNPIFLVILILQYFILLTLSEQLNYQLAINKKFSFISETPKQELDIHQRVRSLQKLKLPDKTHVSRFSLPFDSELGKEYVEGREQNQLIQKFPEGVAIVKFNLNKKHYVDLINDRMKQLLDIEQPSMLIQKLGMLTDLKEIVPVQNEKKKLPGSLATFKSFGDDQQDGLFFKRIANRADTNLQSQEQLMKYSGKLQSFNQNQFSKFNQQFSEIESHRNLFEKVLLQAKIQLFRKDVQNILASNKLQCELFSTLKGLVEEEVLNQLNIQIQDGRQRSIEIKLYLQYLNLQPQIFILVRDVSHRDYIEVLKEHNKAKQNSLNFVSHEFRTPLNCIILLLDNCEEDIQFTLKNNNDQQWLRQHLQYIQISKQQAQYLLNLSNDLLDLAQMKVGKFKLNKSKFNLQQLLLSCLELFKLNADKNQINLQLIYDQDCPKFIFSDEIRIKQIIINLVGNAFKFTKQGSVQIIVKKFQSKDLEIFVKDTGTGINENDQKSLMNAFCKGNSDENKNLNKQGVGLGLLISNLIIKNLNADNIGLKCQSTYGQGSTFYFRISNELLLTQSLNSKSKVIQEAEDGEDEGFQHFLQNNRNENNQIQSENNIIESLKQITETNNNKINSENQIQKVYVAKTRQNQTKKNLKPSQCQCSKILIVDDVESNILGMKLFLQKKQLILVQQFKKEDIRMLTKRSVEKLLLIYCCKTYKIIFLDLEMPGKDGFETFVEINKLSLSIQEKTTVIACSGYSQESEKQKVFDIGMNGYLEKPINKGQMMKYLEKFLEEKK